MLIPNLLLLASPLLLKELLPFWSLVFPPVAMLAVELPSPQNKMILVQELVAYNAIRSTQTIAISRYRFGWTIMIASRKKDSGS